MPAEIPNAQMYFVNATRGFQSLVSYQCDPGYQAVGRTTLMCDVDERWNGPPPRCDPVFCEEPLSIRNGAFSLSTNSTVVGTIVTYYCTSARYVLVGVPKMQCLKDGTYDAPTPECRLRETPIAPAAGGILQTDRAPASMAPNRFPNRDTPTIVRRPILKKKIPFNEEMRPIRRKPGFRPLDETSNPDPRFPIKNEIPDSANVRANQGPRADVPPVSAVQNERDARANSLNLGGIIALGVFGGFVFLAAIITTIVILIRRKDPGPSSSHMQHRRHHRHSHSGSSSTDTGSSREVESRGNNPHRGYRTSEEVRDESEMVISAVEKPKHHHHHHHHRHKHRPRESESSSKSRY